MLHRAADRAIYSLHRTRVQSVPSYYEKQLCRRTQQWSRHTLFSSNRHRIDTLFLTESDESALYAVVESIPYSLLLLRALHASSRSYGGGKHAMAAAMVRYLIFLLEWVRASQPINKLLIRITVIYRPSSFQWRLTNTVNDGPSDAAPYCSLSSSFKAASKRSSEVFMRLPLSSAMKVLPAKRCRNEQLNW
jgi:hypothetical protein